MSQAQSDYKILSCYYVMTIIFFGNIFILFHLFLNTVNKTLQILINKIT